MQNKICLIHHFAGLGDIFFLQGVARKYISMGYHIIWPVRDDILWIRDYIPDIYFCSTSDNFIGKEYYGQDILIISPQFVYLGMMNSHMWGNNDNKVMSSKYHITNIDWNCWSNNFIFNRNFDKENELYYNVLNLKDDSEFVFINNLYNTDIRNIQLFSPEQFDIDVVELKIIDGFTLFDWIKVLEKSKKIYTINTSINYIIEVIDTSYEEYVIYAHNEQNKKEIDYLFKKPHIMLCK